MDKNLFTLLKNYLKGNVTGQDREHISSWYDNLDQADARFKSPFVKRRIKDTLWANIQANTAKPAKSVILMRYWPIAATVLIIATVGLFYANNIQNNRIQRSTYLTVTVPVGTTKRITLTDGSQVWLNSGSQFSYPARFSDTSRLVKLIRGEAFFEISKDPNRPFRVGSEKITTSVIGTSFNIRTLRSSGLYQIRVMTGKVKVSSGNSTLATLTKHAGLNAHLYTGERIALTAHHDTKPSWMSGTVQLESASFSELADVMDLYYGVKVSSADIGVLHGSYSLTFDRKDQLNTVLEIISSINGMQYQRQGNQVIIK